jgi:hypothetical protein
MKCAFYVQYAFSVSLTVFEIIKQKACYENIFELPYLAVSHGLQGGNNTESFMFRLC